MNITEATTIQELTENFLKYKDILHIIDVEIVLRCQDHYITLRLHLATSDREIMALERISREEGNN